MTKLFQVAASDIARAVAQHDLAGTLGWQDIKQRYRRSKLGPFWLTISMGVLIGSLGLVFGGIFNAPMRDFLPFLAIGFMIWGYISSVINEGCGSFINSEAIIKQLPLPMFLHVMRVMWRNLIILAHNAVILPVVYIIFNKSLGWISLLSILGLAVITLTLGWLALLAGLLCARYRDLSQIIASVLQITFYITPIVWMPSQLSGNQALVFLDLNPVYHLIEVVRLPLLGFTPSAMNWIVSVGVSIFGWLVTILIYSKYKNRISYWL